MQARLLGALLAASTAACRQAEPDASLPALFERAREDVRLLEIEPAENPDFIPLGRRPERLRVWDRLRGPEQELVAKGAAATPLLLGAARDRSQPAAWRRRCLRIQSQLRDPAAAPAALALLEADEAAELKVEALRVLALLRDPALRERLRALPALEALPRKRVLWTLGMLGDRRAEGEFLGRAEEAVRALAFDPAAADPNPLPEVPTSKPLAPVLQPPVPVGDVPDDLTELSLLENPAAVGVLIQGLAARETLVLDTAEHLLGRCIDGDLAIQTGVPWRDSVNLYSHRTFQNLWRWWLREKDRVRWDAGKRKFAIAPR